MDLVAIEDRCELVLIEVLWEVRNIQIGVSGLRELLQLTVEGLTGERGLVAAPGKGTNAILGILEAEVLDKAKSKRVLA